MKILSLIQIFFQKSFYNDMDVSLSQEILRKISLIQLFNFIGFIFVMPLGFQALFTQQYTIAFPLLGASVVLFYNYYYLKKSNNDKITSHVISMLFFILMLYLTYTGGVNETGHLWISSLPLIVFFILGLQKGFIYIFSFLLLLSIILFFPFESTLKASYSYDYKLRIILSFLVITFLAALYEYNNAKSFNSMKKLKEELEHYSIRDHLTSLYNRRGYEKNIKNIKNAQGVILMCDIDHFKQINDTYGHDAGDFILKKVALEIKSILREEDVAVRWGGEEFFIFLPQANMENGYFVAEKIRKSIESLILNYEGAYISVTFSIGIEELGEEVSLENAITNADNALYIAKKAGRNTVVKYSD